MNRKEEVFGGFLLLYMTGSVLVASSATVLSSLYLLVALTVEGLISEEGLKSLFFLAVSLFCRMQLELANEWLENKG